MEQDKKNIPTCLMMAAKVETPVSLACVFDNQDLKDTGIEFDSHITLLYSHEYLDKDEVFQEAKKATLKKLDFQLLPFLESQKDIQPQPVFDLFDLGNFENESGYVVLKLKKDTGLYDICSAINSHLLNYFDIKSDFPTYEAHVTLAEVESGKSEKYLDNEMLNRILQDSIFNVEDLILSYDLGVKEYKAYDLTQFFSCERYFRIKENIKEAKEIM